MESLKDYKEPRLVSVLDEKGNDGQNLLAVMELYADKTPYGISQERNHVLITIYEKNSLADYAKATVDKYRVLYIRKGASADTEASLQLAGAISNETLKRNVAQFNKKVKAFNQANMITYQVRTNESVSNRSLLVGALESTLQHEQEGKRLAQYRAVIPKLEEQERRLRELNGQIRELSFAKGKRDKAKIAALREEAVKTANRISLYDRKLMSLEATAPLKAVLEREKARAYQKAEEKGRLALRQAREASRLKQKETDRRNEVAAQSIHRKRTALRSSFALCSRYLFSRSVTRQLSSAYMCLTSVFGMGTGGPT